KTRAGLVVERLIRRRYRGRRWWRGTLQEEELGVDVGADRNELGEVDVDAHHRPDVEAVDADIGRRASACDLYGVRAQRPDEVVAAADSEVGIHVIDAGV